MTTSEFGDQAACMAAGESFQSANATEGWRINWSCNTKSSQ
jgi:hypothetical protein